MKAMSDSLPARGLARRLCAAALCLLLVSSLGAAAFADLIYGYFRYTVEDQSVTITAYIGPETVVTVPAMIGGCPVNAVAADAFAGTDVQAVYLPDTIETVTDGAFAEQQEICYFSAAEGGPQSDPSLGIPTESGGIVTTDDQGNLLLVDEYGQETVLSDSGEYTRRTEDGKTVIQNAQGASVSVSGTFVSFPRGGDTVTVELSPSGTLEHSAARDADFEEAEADDLSSALPAEAAPSPEKEDAPAPQSVRKLLVLSLGLLVVLLACGATIRFGRSKRSRRKRS